MTDRSNTCRLDLSDGDMSANMASEGQATSSEQQALRTDPTICAMCGIEWFSNRMIREKNRVLKIQQGILNDHLIRASHINHLNEFRITSLTNDAEGNARLAESSRQANFGLQRQLDTQQKSIDIERKDHARAVEYLEVESSRREETERRLEHERAKVQNVTDFLNKLGLEHKQQSNTTRANAMCLQTVFHELQTAKSEVKSLRNELQHKAAELQHKQLVLESLSADFAVHPRTRSETIFSESEESRVETPEVDSTSTA